MTKRSRVLIAIAAATTVALVLLGLERWNLTPGSVVAEKEVKVKPRDFLGVLLLDGNGQPIQSVKLTLRARSMLDLMNTRGLQIQEGEFVEVSLPQRLRRDGEFTLVAPRGLDHNLSNADQPAGNVTNVRVHLRLLSGSERAAWFMGVPPDIDFKSLESDELEIVDGRKRARH